MKRLVAGLMLLLAVAACSEENPPPDNLIPEDTYIDLMVELQLIRSLDEQSEEPVPTDSLRQAAFRKHGVDSMQFEESHRYYRQQLDQQKRRLGLAIERLRRDRMIRTDTTSAPPPDTDTADTAGPPLPPDTAGSDTVGPSVPPDTAGTDTTGPDTAPADSAGVETAERGTPED